MATISTPPTRFAPRLGLASLRSRSRNPLERWGLRPIAIEPDQRLAPESFVDSGSGRAVVESIGHGPPLLALPGFAGSANSWRPLAAEFDVDYRWLLVDPPGYGLADKPAGADYRATAQARRVLGVMNRLAIDRAVLLASSASAPVGLTAAILAAEKVKALILVAPFLAPTRATSLLMALARLRPIAFLGGRLMATRQAVALANRLGTADDRLVTDEVIDEQFLPFGSPRYTNACFELIEQLNPSGVEPLLPEISTPVLAVLGEKDAACDTAATRRLLERLPACTRVEYSDCGHLVQFERPRALARVIANFLSTVP